MGKRTESYWPADTSVALQNRTVGDLLREAAMDSPNAVGLVAGIPGVDRRWTFAEIERASFHWTAERKPDKESWRSEVDIHARRM